MNYPSPAFEQKIVTTPEELEQKANTLPRPLVFTNGCFDILHRGHVTYLAQARALGASLVVGVNSDASVKRLGKGEDRPINNQDNRMAVLAALDAVDLVVCFDDDTPYSLIQRLRPNILVKGGDWSIDKIVGATEVLAAGGQVHSIPFLFTTSTTATLEKIRTSNG